MPEDKLCTTAGRGQNLTYGIAENLGIAIVTGRYTKDNPVEAEHCTQYGAILEDAD